MSAGRNSTTLRRFRGWSLPAPRQERPEWEEIELEDIELQEGRPRIMDAYVTFMFMMARGYGDGVSTRSLRNLTKDSRTMYVLLKNKGIKMPAESTISENVNAVRNATRDMIHWRHLEEVRAEGLDDFAEMTLDSTGVEADTAWPTDSMITRPPYRPHLAER